MQMQAAGRGCSSRGQHKQHKLPLQRSRVLVCRVRASTSNGNGKVQQLCPTPAETARTVADLSVEAVLCTMTAENVALGTPVGYHLDKDGNPVIFVSKDSPEAANIGRSSRCGLLVQPTAYPARGVASVALQGSAAVQDDQTAAPDGTTLFKLEVDSCVYYGGLDQVCVAHASRQGLQCVCTAFNCHNSTTWLSLLRAQQQHVLSPALPGVLPFHTASLYSHTNSPLAYQDIIYSVVQMPNGV